MIFEGPLECLGGLDERFIGLGVMLVSVLNIFEFASGMAGVPLGSEMDFSDVGGDGGVGVSDAMEEADFVGGVATVGEEFDVVGENWDKADCGRAKSGSTGEGFLLC